MSGRNDSSPSRWANVTRALRNSRNYRLFIFGRSVSMIGMWMQQTALLWLVGTMYPDERIAAFWLGVVGFCGQIPALVLTPLAGAVADRVNRHKAVLVTQIVSMLQAFVLAGLVFADYAGIGSIIALSVCLGLIKAFDIPLRQSFVVEMVDDPEDLGNAIALNSTVVNLGRLIGPALGGMTAAFWGVGFCFLLNGIGYMFVVVSLLMMRLKPVDREVSGKSVLGHLAEGFRYSFGFTPIRSVILLLALTSLTAIPYASLLPVFASHVLDSGSKGYGLLVSGAGIGAVCGAVYLASRVSVWGLDRLFAVAPLVMGTGLILFSQSRTFAVSLLIMPFIGVGQMFVLSAGNTLLQTIVDNDKRGRVMSFYSMAFMGVMPVGSLLAGIVARHIGAPMTVAAGGAISILGALVYLWRLPALRQIVHPIYQEKGLLPKP